VGCAVLGGCSFGMEFQHRTFPLLLSQPIARSVLWRDKMLVLGAGILGSIVVTLVCLRAYWHGFSLAPPFALVLIGLCAFCGAPFWTLRLRHGVAGMAFAAAAPIGLLGIFALVTQRLVLNEEIQATAAVILIILYCAVVYWRGYVLFQRLEACERVARELSLPAGLESVLVRPWTKLSSRFRGPFATLLKKEFRLQQISFLLAGVFLLIAVVGFCLIPIHKNTGIGTVIGDFGFFVVILPLVAGVIAVTEEKGWDLAEWHLTLPPSALQQWSAKMLATFSTSLGLGLLLPTAMFLAGAALLNPSFFRGGFQPDSGLAAWVLGQLLLTSVAVYAGSFSRSGLKAILAAVGIVAAGFGVLTIIGDLASKTINRWGYQHVENQGSLVPLVLLAGLFLMLCLTQWFAWLNFRRFGSPAGRVVIQLLLIILAVSVFAQAFFTARWAL
jgi:hypothetical protein